MTLTNILLITVSNTYMESIGSCNCELVYTIYNPTYIYIYVYTRNGQAKHSETNQ